jgi:sugar lactone lactonase YvrE
MFDGSYKLHQAHHPVTIPNSLSWAPDGKTIYFTSSVERTIFAFDYSSTTTALLNGRVFYKHPGNGEPDGHRIDVEGNLWTAIYGESRVVKLSPEGQLIGEIKLPTRNITCVEFVGTELYITTAAMEENEGSAEEVALSGALFRLSIGTTGLSPNLFKSDKI